MNLPWWLKQCYLKYKRQILDFCGNVTVWHLPTYCAVVKFVKTWISSHFPGQRDPATLVRSCQECPRIDWRGQSCWLHPWESGPEVVQRPGGVTTSLTLLGRSLCGASVSGLSYFAIQIQSWIFKTRLSQTIVQKVKKIWNPSPDKVQKINKMHIFNENNYAIRFH